MGTASTAVTALGDRIRDFVSQSAAISIVKNPDGVIKAIEGENSHKELFRSIGRLARNALLTKQGKHRELSANSLKKYYGFEVKPLTKDEEGWLDVGIVTPVGIIQYDNT